MDDRLVSFLSIPGGLSLAYPSTWGHRLFVGTGGWNDKAQQWTAGAVLEVALGDLARPTIVASTEAAQGPVFGLEVRDERLLAATGERGLSSFDVSHAPFLVGQMPSGGAAQSVAGNGGLAVLGVGQRDGTCAVSGGERCRLVSTEASALAPGGAAARRAAGEVDGLGGRRRGGRCGPGAGGRHPPGCSPRCWPRCRWVASRGTCDYRVTWPTWRRGALAWRWWI